LEFYEGNTDRQSNVSYIYKIVNTEANQLWW